MPRRYKGPRLFLDKTRDQWVIRDKDKNIRTRYSGIDECSAKEQLAQYIDEEYGIPHEVIEERKHIRKHFIGTVYILRFSQFVKIGYTNDLCKRLKNINTFSPIDPEICAKISGSRVDELALHHRFKEYRLRREWFKYEGELAEWIDDGCPYEAISPPPPPTRTIIFRTRPKIRFRQITPP